MTPLHPALVHLPLALSALMPLLSLALLVAWWRGWLPRRAWTVAVAVQAVLVLSGLAALASGQRDGERVEATVGEKRVDAHEDAAETFLAGAGLLLVAALGTLALRNERAARTAAAATVLGSVAVLGLAVRTGQAGGALVYQHGAATAYASTASAPAATHGHHREVRQDVERRQEGAGRHDRDDDD